MKFFRNIRSLPLSLEVLSNSPSGPRAAASVMRTPSARHMRFKAAPHALRAVWHLPEARLTYAIA